MAVIYLDQWVWISFLRCKKQLHPEHPAIDKAYKNINATSSSGKHQYPISLYHWIETGKRGKIESRRDLFELMFTVSNFNSISPWVIVLEHEVRNAVIASLKGPQMDLTDVVFIKGFEGVMGAKAQIVAKDGTNKEPPQDVLDKINDYVSDPKKMADAMVSMNFDNIPDESVDELDNLAKIIERDRKTEYGQKDKTLRRNVADVRFFLEIISERLIKILNEQHISQKWYMDNVLDSKEKIIEFMKNVPTGYIFHILNYENNIDFSRQVTSNDLYDIWPTSIAVPYCDMVVIEKRWANILKKYKLDEEYSTNITHRISDLEDM